MHTLWIALAGALGAVARYRIALAVGVRSFPWTTFGINLGGCFLLGVLLAGPGTGRWPPSLTAALGIGFLGAFTTFSTFGYETFTLMREGRAGTALLYATASVVGGILAAGSGYAVGRAFA